MAITNLERFSEGGDAKGANYHRVSTVNLAFGEKVVE
jgi:hypothetical protein